MPIYDAYTQPSTRRAWMGALPGLFLGVLLTLGVPSSAASPDEATRVLVDRIVRAHGGAEAIERVAAVLAEGEIQARLRGGQGSYRRWFDRPRLLRVETAYPHESETRILNGDKVWRGSNGGAPKAVDGQARLAVVYQYKQLDLPHGLLKGLYQLRHAGREVVDGVETEVLDAWDEEGPPMRVNVDAASHLIVRVAGRFSHGGMSIALAIDFTDYRPLDGVPMPHRMHNYAGGQAVSETVIHRYVVNPPADPARFRPPADPLQTARAGF